MKHLVLLVLGALAGWIYGKPLAGVAIAAILSLIWHLYHLAKLRAWLQSADSEEPPSGSGPWPSIFSAIHHNRTVARRNKRRYREMAREWRQITNALPDAGLLLNESFELIEHNDVAARMLNLDPVADRGRPITNIVRNPLFVEMFEDGVFGKPVRISPANDPARTFSCQISPYGRKQFLLIIRDISERRLADKMRSDFVANASHELRTPLTVLNGYLLGMSEDSDLDLGWQEPVAEMRRQVKRMHALVGDLLQLNKLEAQPDAPLLEVDAAALLNGACKDASKLRENTAQISFTNDANANLLGDASALGSICTNLLSNAVRFTSADGLIEVRWWVDDDGGHISVSDNGIGIPEDDLARITERFYRTDAGRARCPGGTGLGLAIVKHALASHQARLEINSEAGGGSVFTCHFPPSRVRSISAEESPD